MKIIAHNEEPEVIQKYSRTSREKKTQPAIKPDTLSKIEPHLELSGL